MIWNCGVFVEFVLYLFGYLIKIRCGADAQDTSSVKSHECSQTYILYRNTVTPSRNLDNMTSYDTRQCLIMLLSKDLDSVFLALYNKRGQVEDFASNHLSATRFLSQLYVNDSSFTVFDRYAAFSLLVVFIHCMSPAMCSREWCGYCPPGHYHIIQFCVSVKEINTEAAE